MTRLTLSGTHQLQSRPAHWSGRASAASTLVAHLQGDHDYQALLGDRQQQQQQLVLVLGPALVPQLPVVVPTLP